MPIRWRLQLFGLLIITFAFPSLLQGQTSPVNPLLQVQHFGIDDGLSSRIVHCFFQDSRGFMWVGTAYGLNRFDGIQFQTYTKEQHGLSKNRITKIIELSDGKLWLSSSSYRIHQVGNTVDVFDPITAQSVPITDWVSNPEVLAGEQVYNMFLGKHDEVYLASLSGRLYHYKNKKLRLFANLSPSIKLYKLRANADGSVWLDARTQLIHLSKEGKVAAKVQAIKGMQVDLISITKEEMYYEIGTDNRGHSDQDRTIWQYRKNSSDSLIFTIDKTYLRLFIDIPKQEVGVIHTTHKTFGLLSFQQNDSSSFQNWNHQLLANTIDFVSFQDRQGGLWVTNVPNGITRIQKGNHLFKNYLQNQATKFHNTSATRGIIIDPQQRLTIASRQLLHQFVLDSTNQTQSTTSTLIRKERVLLAFLADQDQLWVASSYGSLLHLSNQNEIISNYHYPPKAQEKVSMTIKLLWHWSILKDRQQKIWLGHQHGLSYLSKDDGYLHFYAKLNGFEALKQSTVNYMHENDMGIWLVSTTGLYLLDTEKGVQARFSATDTGKYYLPHSQFHHIYEDEDGYFWLSSNGGGLIKWHPKTYETKQFNTKNGLSHNVLYAAYEDDYANLWLSSNRGIMRFEKNNHRVTTYLPIDGITHEEFNRISHYQATDGTIYFGGLNGVTSFHPKDFQENTDDEPIDFLQFTQLRVQNGSSGNWEDQTSDVIYQQRITLNPQDLGFYLSFADLDFSNQTKRQFAYRMEGIDQQWNYQQANFIRVNNLPYGNFKLCVKAQSRNGIWGQEKIIAIQVLKPVYLQTWFLGLIAVLLFASIYLFVKWRLYQAIQHQKELQVEVQKRTVQIEADKQVILKQTKELTKLDRLKSRFFANISHELRTPLTLILGPAKHIQAKEQKLAPDILATFQTIENNGENLLQLVEEILELAKLEANEIKVNERPIILEDLLARLYANFESQAQYLGIRYELTLPPTKHPVLLDVNKSSKIVNNLISNALKFTPKGKSIQITASIVHQEYIEIQVVDTGKGIYAEDISHLFERFYQSKQDAGMEQGGTGIGLALSKELAEVMKGTIQVESTLGEGTIFTVRLPYKATELTEIPLLASNGTATKTVSPNQKLPSVDQKDAALPHLLIVEDNASMQAFICDVLKDLYQVHAVQNGKEALAFLTKGEAIISLIISDVMMPEMDGFTLLKRLKADEKWQKIPVIMLTARASEGDRLNALQIGVDDYLTKPFSTNELHARIQNLLQHYQERQFWQQTVSTEEEITTAPTVENKASYSENERNWLKKLENIMTQHIGHHHFTMEDVADAMHLSQRQMGRKLKQLTGLTPLKFQRELQLQQARQLLEKGTYATVSEVVHQTGFKTHHHFTQLYVERFGKKPSEYLRG